MAFIPCPQYYCVYNMSGVCIKEDVTWMVDDLNRVCCKDKKEARNSNLIDMGAERW